MDDETTTMRPVRVSGGTRRRRRMRRADIMPGVTIGDNCIIGCGTIVTHDIPANSIVVGVPGRVIESVGEYAAKHDDDFMHTKKMATDEKKAFVLGHLR
jgi:carbonic anhydrase/acetyltransferase-like protein (isoleucine patch superfamily)